MNPPLRTGLGDLFLLPLLIALHIPGLTGMARRLGVLAPAPVLSRPVAHPAEERER